MRPERGSTTLGCDFSERDEDEGTLRQAGMRNFQTGFGESEIAEEENVEVEGARTVGYGARAIAPEEALNGEKSLKKWMRCEIGFKCDDGVKEARLIGQADGLSGVERRTRGDAAEPGDLVECRGERGVGRAGGAGKVCAESDVGEGHADLRVAELAQFSPPTQAKLGWGTPE